MSEIHNPLFRRNVIYCSGTTGEYLHRWTLLRSRWLGVFLHRFVRSAVAVYHDHPWDFWSLILKGGYVERRPQRTPNVRRPLSIAFRRAEDLHYVKLLGASCWTLVVRFRRRREWGFRVRGAWMPWREYVR